MELKTKLTIITVLVTLLTTVSYAQNERIEDIYRKLTDRYDSIKTYKADFVQTNIWSERDMSLESRGEIMLWGDKFVMSYKEPSEQKIIVDSLVYIIDEVEKSIIITYSEIHLSPISIINLYRDRSSTQIMSETESEITIMLTPTDDNETKSITVAIRKNHFLIAGIEYEDFEMNKVQFLFSNEILDKPLDKKHFTVPDFKGYTVLDGRDN